MQASNTKGSIRCVIDPSHESWVLGGLMRELANSNEIFNDQLFVLPSPKKLFQYLKVRWHLIWEEVILFSSLTPLQNYVRIPVIRKRQEVRLWFTHKEGQLSEGEIKCLKRANHIFVHSSKELNRLKELGCASVTLAIGAIDQQRFAIKSNVGEDIVWIGTPSERKRPKLFLEYVRNSPEFHFRLLGHGWEDSIYWNEVNSMTNLRYITMAGPLTSRDLDGCFAYLMTSEVEGGPMPLLETLAAGLAPIVTDCGFVRDIFEFCEIPSQFIFQSDKSFVDQILNLKKSWPEHENEVRNRVLQLDFLRFSKIITQVSA